MNDGWIITGFIELHTKELYFILSSSRYLSNLYCSSTGLGRLKLSIIG